MPYYSESAGLPIDTIGTIDVADIGSWRSTTQSYLEWVRQRAFSRERVSECERRAKFGKWFSIQGWFGVLGILKWIALRMVNLSRIIGMPPVSRQGLFKWATKSTSLACENLMIAAEVLGLNTCPMGGFRWPQTLEIPVAVLAISSDRDGHRDREEVGCRGS